MNHRQQNKYNKISGFTLAEMLVVIGMISILLSIGGLGVVQYQKTLELSRLDTTARQIFVVAQNQIIKAKASGRWNQNLYLGEKMTQKPSDYPGNSSWQEDDKGSGHDYRYIVYNKTLQTFDNGSTQETILDTILPKDVIDEQIRTEGQYIIEYDYATGNVYGVFYTESDQSINYERDIIQGLDSNHKLDEKERRNRTARKNYKTAEGSMMIGYYGGGTGITVDTVDSSALGSFKMKIENDKDLKIYIINDQSELTQTEKNIKKKISITVTGEESTNSENKVLAIEGAYTNSTDQIAAKEIIEGNQITYIVTLDSMDKDGVHFADLFPKLIPGENIIITAQISGEEVLAVPVQLLAYTNSLFELKENNETSQSLGATAIISNVRHLQNLSIDFSKLRIKENEVTGQIITKVSQIKNINRKDPNEKDTTTEDSIIEEIEFDSINNKALQEYQGNGFGIGNLNIMYNSNINDENNINNENDIKSNPKKNVGLFAQIAYEDESTEFTVNNLTLENINIHIDEGNAGALVGSIEKGTFAGTNISVINPTIKLIKGNAGGLIGNTEKNLTIKNLSINQPKVEAEKESSIGGVIGEAKNNVTITSIDDMEAKNNVTITFINVTEPIIQATEGSHVGGLVGKVDGEFHVSNIGISKYLIKGGAKGNAGALVGEVTNNVAATSMGTLESIIQAAEESYVGGLIGKVGGEARIDGIGINTDSITVGTNGYAGTLLGEIEGNLTIQGLSVNQSKIEAGEDTKVGGLVGETKNKVVITSIGVEEPIIQVAKGSYAGGLIGKTGGILEISNMNITKGEIKGGDNVSVGGLIGESEGTLMITGTTVTETELEVGNDGKVGGTIGRTQGELEINGITISKGSIKGGDNVSGGGIIGEREGDLIITATVNDIEVEVGNNGKVGGWIGKIKGNIGINYTNISKGLIKGGDNVSGGGFIGESEGVLTITGTSVFETDIEVGIQGKAGGLVGEAKNQLIAEFIEVKDPTIKAANGQAGGLVGRMQNGTIEQSRIYLTDETQTSASQKYKNGAYKVDSSETETKIQENGSFIMTQAGCVGGLIGIIEGQVTVKKSFAAIPVKDEGNNGVAGGLVGEISKDTQVIINDSYTSGYTEGGTYTNYYSVAATGDNGIAGGFIGKDSSANTKIEYSYTTASVYGSTVGGFIGEADNKKSDNQAVYISSYATGKVEGSNKKPFIGKLNNEAIQVAKDCYYLIQSNPKLEDNKQGIKGLGYNELINNTDYKKTSEGRSNPYDEYWKDNQDEKQDYPFGTVMQFKDPNQPEDIVHYGDWPKKEEIESVSRDVGIIYYEIIKDEETQEDKFYYHGWFKNFGENGSDPKPIEDKTKIAGAKEKLNEKGLVIDVDRYVVEEGYLILISKEKKMTPEDIAIQLSPATGERFTLKDCMEDEFKRKNLVPIEGYDIYHFKYPNANTINNPIESIKIGENISKSYPEFGKYTMFNFNPNFADGVEKSTPEVFYIRSERHLLRLDELTDDYNGKGITYKQNIDINCGMESGYSFKTINRFNNGYTVEGAPDKTRGYSYAIKGLTEPLFQNIENRSTINGITLIDSRINGKASFAITNNGEIYNCKVHAGTSKEDGYDAVSVSSADKVAGFVYTNQKIIKNSYFVGTVIGDNVGGFVYESYGTIESCYVNAIVEGNTSAAAFIQEHTGGDIINSFAVGTVKSNENNGISYGFLEKSYSPDKIDNCYTALIELKGSKVYTFGRAYNPIDGGWLDTTNIKGEVQKGEENGLKEQGKMMYYDEMAEKGTNPKTYWYSDRLYELTYPFEIISADDTSLEFWGDWPLKDNLPDDIGMFYYEIVKDQQTMQDKFYYHGYLAEFNEQDNQTHYIELKTDGANLVNGLLTGPNQYVIEDGYVILAPKGISSNNIVIELTGNDNIIKLSECTELLQRDDLFSMEGFHAYYFTKESLVDGLAKINIDKKINKNNSQIGERVSFVFNPYFADTVSKSDTEQNILYVRSARQLLNVSKLEPRDIYSNKIEYRQNLDISYQNINFTQNGKYQSYDYQTTNEISSNYTALECSGINKNYSIKGLKVPLFGTIKENTTIKGVTLLNSVVEGVGDAVSFAKINKGEINNCKVHAANPGSNGYDQVVVHGWSQAVGFVDCNETTGIIENSYFVGTVKGNKAIGFINTNKGKIENCYANLMVLGQEFGTGFINSNEGIINNCFVAGSVEGGTTAYGFIKNDEETGKIGKEKGKECYSIVDKLTGNAIYMFGVGKGDGYNTTTCYLKDVVTEGTIITKNQVSGGIKLIDSPKAYDQMPKAETTVTTHPYSSDLKGQTYPFKLNSSMEFWGDWPVKK